MNNKKHFWDTTLGEGLAFAAIILAVFSPFIAVLIFSR